MTEENKNNIIDALRNVVQDEIQPLREDITNFKGEILDSNEKILKIVVLIFNISMLKYKHEGK